MQRKPDWLKKRLNSQGVIQTRDKLKKLGLYTVCEEAKCPNLNECYSKGVATVMIMGDTCTRSCKFCAVKTGRPAPLDEEEPLHTAEWIKNSGFKHIVITSVDRDDLKDLGSHHFAKTIELTKIHAPHTTLEVLTPDFQGREDCLEIVLLEKPHVFNHNLETTRRLTPSVRSASNYDRSLKVIEYAKKNFPEILTKSGIMLGLGEKYDEIIETLKDLVNHGCDILTLGQYLQPSKKHLEVQEYITPETFDKLRERALEIGFKEAFCGPFVRSSYMADHVYQNLSALKSFNL